MKRKQKALLITETVKKGKSQNQTANKFRISQSYVCRILRKKDLRAYKKQKFPLVRKKLKKLNVVPKDCNSPNTPQIRAIEDFFGILKQTVYSNNWTANDHKQLKIRIKYCLEKKIDSAKICDEMKNVCKKV